MPPQPPPSVTALSSASFAAVPEGDDHAAGLEEDDVVAGFGACLPAERLVELPRAAQVRDSKS